jgi:hypothetical protein
VTRNRHVQPALAGGDDLLVDFKGRVAGPGDGRTDGVTAKMESRVWIKTGLEKSGAGG